MKHIREEINILEGLLTPSLNFELLDKFFIDGSFLYDIETTGFSANYSSLYLIGFAHRVKDTLIIEQLFAETPSDEANLIKEFVKILSSNSAMTNLISFNGEAFDMNFLKKKCSQLDLAFEMNFLDNCKSIDIYKIIFKEKKIFQLENYKQKTIEKFLGIDRDDLYSGGDLIQIYKNYVKKPTQEALDLLLLHNHDDVLGLFKLLPILSYLLFFKGNVSLNKIQQNVFKDINGEDKIELLFTLNNLFKVPKPLSFASPNTEGIYFKLGCDQTIIRIPLFCGILKHFYKDYKNYYYLPAEDYAIHKSLSTYIDKDYRTQATASNCYTKKASVFLPQYSEFIEPLFKLDYKNKISYFLCTPDFLESDEKVLEYLKYIISLQLNSN